MRRSELLELDYLIIKRPVSVISFRNKSMVSLWTFRIDSIVLVEQFSRLIKITLGGLPYYADMCIKSLSLVTITNSFFLENSQIKSSSLSRPKWNTWLEPGYSFENRIANWGDKLASNKSFKESRAFYFDQLQKLERHINHPE